MEGVIDLLENFSEADWICLNGSLVSALSQQIPAFAGMTEFLAERQGFNRERQEIFRNNEYKKRKMNSWLGWFIGNMSSLVCPK